MPTDNGYSSWVGLVYVFNLIVGTGALALPAVFAKAGWALGLVLVISLAFVGFVTVTFVVETMACANAVLIVRRIQSRRTNGEETRLADGASDSETDTDEETSVVPSNRSRYYTLDRCVQLGEMTRLFFGRFGRFVFYVSLCAYLYGDLSIYVSAVAKTLGDLVCEGDGNSTSPCLPNTDGGSVALSAFDVYRLFVLAFVFVVGPFSYFDLQKTKYLQVATSSMRWCAFSVMIGIAVARIVELGPRGQPPAIDLHHLPHLIGTSVYSFMCHHSLPGLVTPFRDKTRVVRQLGLDYALICTFYLLLALTGAFAFHDLRDLYTLDFVPVSDERVGWFVRAVEYFLGLFPVFTLSTSFPIIAVTLQSNLKCLFLNSDVSEQRYGFFVRRLLFPTMAVFPPALIALTTYDLSSLVSFTGTYAGSVIQYLVPTFLVLRARNICRTNLAGATNKFASPFRGVSWALFVVVWCVACVCLSSLNLYLVNQK